MPQPEKPLQPPRKDSMDDLVKGYRLYLKMMQYPSLLDDMRKIFIQALSERGIITQNKIEELAREKILQSGLEINETNLREYTNALIDLYFAHYFDEVEIENHVNLARKQEAFQRLNEVVNREDATSFKIKKALKEFCKIPQGNLYIPPSEAIGVRVALISHFISNQLPFLGVAKNHITIRDIDELMDHSYWNRRRSGKIGGKAAGMFLAYKILLPRLEDRDPELEEYIRIPESYYFNSGNLSDFLDYNRLYSFHSQKYKTSETIEEDYKNMSELFERAAFPPDVTEDFRKFLKKVGEHPIILRSSSLLEDNFGYAFSGKYESVFLTNQGDLQTRLNDFIWGLKRVLMSTFSPAAIFYRRDHNLIDFDERMSVLVQKVVGTRYGPYFFPFAAGVAFSQNAYVWTTRIKREEGFVRLVLGLGTRAVDRIESDYPRKVPLSHPTLRPEVSAERIKKYSQKMVDVLNLENRKLETVPYQQLFSRIEHPDLYKAISIIQDDHLTAPFHRAQEINLHQTCITFENFLTKTPFVRLMKKVLKKLEKAYGHPVDIEFAWDQGKLYLLQCRSLAVGEKVGRVLIPDNIPRDQILFTNTRGVSNSVVRNIEYIVFVDPKQYALIENYEEKIKIGRIVGKLNRILEEKRYALFGPTRWGSNDVKLGVKVGYEDINHTLVLAEIAYDEEDTSSEVSYGTHFFNDLVEAKIVPIAIYPNQKGIIFREGFFFQAPNMLTSLIPDYGAYQNVVRVIHVPSSTKGHQLQVLQDGLEQKGIGFFADPKETLEAVIIN